MLLAAAGVLEKLLKEHLITGKDATAAMNAAPGSLKPGTVPSVVGSTLHFGQAVHASTFAAARSKFACASQPAQNQSRPPVPIAPRSIRSSMPVPRVDMSTPVESSPHGGIGVRAPPHIGATPELIPVASPAGSLASAKTLPKTVTPVYHPPMRTGTSSVRSKNKATIAAAAKPTGLKALQEQQKQLVKNMKVRFISVICDFCLCVFMGGFSTKMHQCLLRHAERVRDHGRADQVCRKDQHCLKRKHTTSRCTCPQGLLCCF